MGSYTPGNMVVQNIDEELANNTNDNMGATGPPDQSAGISVDNSQAESAPTEHNGPIHDRCVHGEINAIWCPLGRNEVYFRISHPYELQPLGKDFEHTPGNMAAVQNINEKLANNSNDNMGATGPPEQSAMISGDNGQAESARTEHNNGPIHRCVHGEINAICCPVDRSEVYFGIARQPYELQPLSRYFLREWSEAEHLFKSAIEFAEEIYSDWSPCPNPTPASIGL